MAGNRFSFLRWREIPTGVWALGCVSLLTDISSEMIHSLLPVYLVTVMGASALTVGLIEGVAEAITPMVKIFSGALSDKLGKRKAITVFGYGLAALTRPVFPLATSIGWIVAARFVDRIGKGIRGAPRDALVADISPPHLRGAAFGLRQSFDAIGAILGPVFALILMVVAVNDFTLVFWLSIIPALGAVAALWWGVKEPDRPASLRQVRNPLTRAEMARLGKAFWLVVMVGAVFTLARFSEAFLILRAESIGLSLALVPVALIIMNVVYTFTSWPAGALSDRMDRTTILGAGVAVLIVADIVLALTDGVPMLALGVALWGLHMGLTQGLIGSMIADAAPAELRGTAYGVFNFVTGLATLAASAIAGGLWTVSGPAATFFAGAVFAACALFALPAIRPRAIRPA